MAVTWFSSDPHYGGGNLVHIFKTRAGSPTREFASEDEMHEVMVAKHNAVVKPDDTWICLGDLAIKQAALHKFMPRLNGKHKILVRGNHDVFGLEHYARYFDDVVAMLTINDVLFSHIAIAPWAFGQHTRANVHGHSHRAAPRVYRAGNPFGQSGGDRQKIYINLSMERTNYAPVSLEQVCELVTIAESH